MQIGKRREPHKYLTLTKCSRSLLSETFGEIRFFIMNGCIDMVNLCIFLAHPALDYLDQEPRGLVLHYSKI